MKATELIAEIAYLTGAGIQADKRRDLLKRLDTLLYSIRHYHPTQTVAYNRLNQLYLSLSASNL